MDEQVKFSAIESYVLSERERCGITNVDTSTKSELSGEGFGELVMLLDHQLMTTVVGYGGWQELEDLAVLDGVYQLVESRTTTPNG